MSENTKNSDEPVVCIELWILFENWNQCYKMRLKINEKKESNAAVYIGTNWMTKKECSSKMPSLNLAGSKDRMMEKSQHVLFAAQI